MLGLTGGPALCYQNHIKISVQINSASPFVKEYSGAAREANSGIHSLQNPVMLKNSQSCFTVVLNK